jgi:hypothetical protein
MIPRKILKKIQQIEIRTNRLVTETRARFSFQPPAQFRRIPCTVPNCGNDHFGSFGVDGEINRVRPRRRNFYFSRQSGCRWKSFRVVTNFSESFINFTRKSLAESRQALIVKINGFDKFPFRCVFNDDPEFHRLARCRFSISAMTSSSGRQRSGCASASAARRSSSAICSGVKSGSIHPSSSPNSSQTFSMNARFSSVGIGRIFSMRSVVLTELNLPAIPSFASA